MYKRYKICEPFLEKKKKKGIEIQPKKWVKMENLGVVKELEMNTGSLFKKNKN